MRPSFKKCKELRDMLCEEINYTPVRGDLQKVYLLKLNGKRNIAELTLGVFNSQEIETFSKTKGTLLFPNREVVDMFLDLIDY